MDFYDFVQDHSIHDARSTAGQASAKATGVQSELYHLQARFEKLCLINQALWELVQEKTSLTDADLLNKATEIDLRDGKLDNKMSPALKSCSQCNRPVSARHGKCLYCGHIENSDQAFQI